MTKLTPQLSMARAALVAGLLCLWLHSGVAEMRMDYLPDGPARPSIAALDAFWAAAVRRHPELGDDYEVRWFGIDARTTRGIFKFISSGEKTGTYSVPWLLEKTGQPPSHPGDNVVLIDYDGTPSLLLRIVDQEVIPFAAIDEHITGLYGPSVRDVDIWKPLHAKFWNRELARYGLAVTDEMPVLVERCQLNYAGPQARPPGADTL